MEPMASQEVGLLRFSLLSCRAKEKGEGRRRGLMAVPNQNSSKYQSWAKRDGRESCAPVLPPFSTTLGSGALVWMRPGGMGQASCLYKHSDTGVTRALLTSGTINIVSKCLGKLRSRLRDYEINRRQLVTSNPHLPQQPHLHLQA